MNDELIELRQVCKEFIELGDMPNQTDMVQSSINAFNFSLWISNDVRLTMLDQDPLISYRRNWVWKELLAPVGRWQSKMHFKLADHLRTGFVYVTNTLVQAEFDDKPTNFPNKPKDKYWRNVFNWALMGDENAIPENKWFYELIAEVEEIYISKATVWVKKRLELEERFINSTLEFPIFQREMVKAFSETKTDCIFDWYRFMEEYWELIPVAFNRYFQNLVCGRSISLTGSEHKKILEIAKNLKKRVDRKISGLPFGFVTSYEDISAELQTFLNMPDPEYIPKKAHTKNPRQVLIRELLLGWIPLEDYPPVKHIFHLVSAVDSRITEREIYREIKLFKNDSKQGKYSRFATVNKHQLLRRSTSRNELS